MGGEVAAGYGGNVAGKFAGGASGAYSSGYIASCQTGCDSHSAQMAVDRNLTINTVAYAGTFLPEGSDRTSVRGDTIRGEGVSSRGASMGKLAGDVGDIARGYFGLPTKTSKQILFYIKNGYTDFETHSLGNLDMATALRASPDVSVSWRSYDAPHFTDLTRATSAESSIFDYTNFGGGLGLRYFLPNHTINAHYMHLHPHFYP